MRKVQKNNTKMESGNWKRWRNLREVNSASKVQHYEVGKGIDVELVQWERGGTLLGFT